MIQQLPLRLARPADSAAIARLLIEGFGRDYGGALLNPAGQRMMERIHALPGRLSGIYVATDDDDRPIGVAGLRTTELRPSSTWEEEQIQIEELGIARAMWLELRTELTEPRMYQLRPDEAFIYSVVVTAACRHQGIATALLNLIHAEAARRGKRRALLEVVATNTAALELYRRLGYVLLKRRRGLLSILPGGVPPRLLLARPLSPA
ncbi:MAG: hypothetical protein NVSMB42_10390 [Herpetosiphon sp.]